MDKEIFPRSSLSATHVRSSNSFSENLRGKRKLRSRNFEFRDFTSTAIAKEPELETLWPKPVIDLIM
jgi:hypothetical protein